MPSTVVFGFPYVDTLKLNERPEFVSGGCTFLPLGEEADLHALEALLDAQMTTSSRVCALFTEIPSNPLLKIQTCIVCKALARKHNFLLIVDDTISGFAQVDLLSGSRTGEMLDVMVVRQSSLVKRPSLPPLLHSPLPPLPSTCSCHRGRCQG